MKNLQEDLARFVMAFFDSVVASHTSSPLSMEILLAITFNTSLIGSPMKSLMMDVDPYRIDMEEFLLSQINSESVSVTQLGKADVQLFSTKEILCFSTNNVSYKMNGTYLFICPHQKTSQCSPFTFIQTSMRNINAQSILSIRQSELLRLCGSNIQKL